MSQTRTPLVLVTLLALLWGAAPASSQSKEMLALMRDMVDLNTRMKLLQTSVDENNAVVKGLVEKIADQVNTISGVMQKMTQSIDGVRAQNEAITKEMRSSLATLNRTVGDLQKDVSSLGDQMKSVSKQVTSLQTTADPLPGPDELWRTAMADLLFGSYGLAVVEFQEFLSKYPADPRVPDAHFNIGDAYFNQQKYDQAITEYDIVLQKHPESDKTRSALYKKGLAQAEQNQPQAIATLQEVVKKFPGTSESQNAQAKIKELQRPASRGKPAR